MDGGYFPNNQEWEDELVCIVPDFFETFPSYKLPLRLHSYDRDERDPVNAEYAITRSAARYYLRDLLEPKRRGTVPFTKLPAELRNIIYEMVLRFPAPGLYISHSVMSKPLKLHSIRRMDEVDVTGGPMEELSLDFAVPQEYADHYLEVNLSKTDLALLKVCRQIHHEAMPIFYGLNTFLA